MSNYSMQSYQTTVLAGPAAIGFEAAFVGTNRDGLDYVYKDKNVKFFFTLVPLERNSYIATSARTERDFGRRYQSPSKYINEVNENIVWMINERRISDLSRSSDLGHGSKKEVYNVTFDWEAAR